MATIEIEPAEGPWVVRTPDGVLVESRRALLLREDGHDPVVYFPRDDAAMALLEPSVTTSHCPRKGDATYFSYIGANGRIDDVAWTYDAPNQEQAVPIAGLLAFFDDKVTVEEL